MTSKIIVNNIEADTGINTVTFNDAISSNTVRGNVIGDITSSGTSTFDVISGVSTIGVTTVHLTGINDLNYPTVGPLSNRNLIVNGAMRISQRGTSTTGINDLTTVYTTVDRGYHAFNGLGTWTSTQESDGPNGFTKSWKVNCTSPDPSPITNDYAILVYRVEAQDLQVLEYGTSNAQTTTFSFYVKSNKTGSASIEFAQMDNSQKQYITTYTINSANTWEYKTITIPGDASGVINDDNGTGVQIAWWLNSGPHYSGDDSLNVWEAANDDARNNTNLGLGGTANDYFQITGIQWELGSQSTPFEHRSYSYELARCQRYYEIIAHWYGGGNDYGTIWSKPLNTFTNCWTDVRFKVTKRAPDYDFGLLGSTAWVGTTPTVHNDGVDAIVFQGSAHYYLNGGSSSARDMAYVESEL